MIVEVDEGVRLRGDQKAKKGEGWSFGNILKEEMFDVDKDGVLSED